jgi:DNA sulfur modification protein DndE
MKPPVDSVRVSAQGRDQLIKLKRQTGIENWNTLCRWALCCSLREKSVPGKAAAHSEVGVDIRWDTFGGEYGEVLAPLVYQRARQDGFEETQDGVGQCFRAHLHRGLGYLASETYLTSESGESRIERFMQRWLQNKRLDKED